jgi:hypothetical protein
MLFLLAGMISMYIFLAIGWIAFVIFLNRWLFKRLRSKLKSGTMFVIARIMFWLVVLPLPVTIMAIIIAYKTHQARCQNYLGFCNMEYPGREQRQYLGKRLGTEERLNLAIKDYIIHQRHDIYEVMESEKLIYRGEEDAATKVTLIPYKTYEEFVNENPSCCELTWDLPEGGKLDYNDMADGVGNGFLCLIIK